jgi:hypothetical protein
VKSWAFFWGYIMGTAPDIGTLLAAMPILIILMVLTLGAVELASGRPLQ